MVGGCPVLYSTTGCLCTDYVPVGSQVSDLFKTWSWDGYSPVTKCPRRKGEIFRSGSYILVSGGTGVGWVESLCLRGKLSRLKEIFKTVNHPLQYREEVSNRRRKMGETQNLLSREGYFIRYVRSCVCRKPDLEFIFLIRFVFRIYTSLNSHTKFFW